MVASTLASLGVTQQMSGGTTCVEMFCAGMMATHMIRPSDVVDVLKFQVVDSVYNNSLLFNVRMVEVSLILLFLRCILNTITNSLICMDEIILR